MKCTDLRLNLKLILDSTSVGKFNELVIMITEAVALLGRTSFELSQLQCEDIKLHLHKDCFDLCSANVPMTERLFGDTLQTQLTHIRVSKTTSTFNHSFSRNTSPSYFTLARTVPINNRRSKTLCLPTTR